MSAPVYLCRMNSKQERIDNVYGGRPVTFESEAEARAVAWDIIKTMYLPKGFVAVATTEPQDEIEFIDVYQVTADPHLPVTADTDSTLTQSDLPRFVQRFTVARFQMPHWLPVNTQHLLPALSPETIPHE